MPIKFKLYQACALYLLLWGSGFLLWAIYESVRSGIERNDAVPIILAFLILSLVVVKAVLSIRAVKHYRDAALHTKYEKGLFIAGYCFIILFTAGILLLIVFVIVPEDFYRRYKLGYQLAPQEALMDTGICLADAAAIYLAILGLPLLKAIRARQAENLMSFEIEGEKI
ncbi:MAG TPA: hypothetical protein VG738_04395 [Chitinophagaceae bacterium]|nr:hypothetical protein [Chitinophagaceae bacterium]